MNYYYADADNQVVGPVTTEQLDMLYRSGKITYDTKVIAEGAEDWHPRSNSS